MQRRIEDVGTAAIALVWLGLVIGVSFIATPIKFAAPTLSLPVALDVGRVTFGLFSRIEWVAAFALIAAALLTRRSTLVRVLCVVAGGIVAIEALWLLPILDARIEAVIAGAPRPASSHHAIYVALELAKVACLAGVAALALLGARAQGARLETLSPGKRP